MSSIRASAVPSAVRTVAVVEHSVDAPLLSDTVLQNLMSSWIQGYLVGAAIFHELGRQVAGRRPPPSTQSSWAFDPPDINAIKLWLDNYCQEHPLEAVDNAASMLAGELILKQNSEDGDGR